MNIPLDPRGRGWSFESFPDDPAADGEAHSEGCPTCDGDGAVLSDRPGVLIGCPTCHGRGTVPITLLTTEQTSVE